MNEIMKAALRFSFVWLAVSLVIWLLLEEWRPVAAGFAAGTLISMANANLLRSKVQQLTEQAAAGGGKRTGLGFGVRVALVLLGALLALRFPHALNLPSVLAGSFIVQLTMLPVAFWHTLRGRG